MNQPCDFQVKEPRPGTECTAQVCHASCCELTAEGSPSTAPSAVFEAFWGRLPSRSRLLFPVCSPAERLHLPDPVSRHPTACSQAAMGSGGSSWSFTRHLALHLPVVGPVGWWRVPGQEQEDHLLWKDRGSGQALVAGV